MQAIRIFAALALTALLTAPLGAQATPPTQGTPNPQSTGQGRQNELLFKGISLTLEQKVKVDSIQTASRDAMRAQMQGGGGTQDSTTRARMQEMRQAQFSEIRKILTAEQVLLFDENVRTLPPMGQGRRPPPR